MSKRIGKVGLIGRLESMTGFSTSDTEKFIDCLSEVMIQELSKGNYVTLPKVCTIQPKMVPEKTMPVGGVYRVVSEHLNLRININKHLKDHYKKEVSEKGKVDRGVRALGDMFHKKE